MSGVELACITLHESATLRAKRFLKNLPLAPLAPPPKLGETRSSFGRRGTFGKSFLPRFCPFCPRRDRFRDEMGAPEHPASVTFVRLDSEGLPYGVVEAACADETEAVGGAAVLSCFMELDRRLLSMVCLLRVGIGPDNEPMYGTDNSGWFLIVSRRRVSCAYRVDNG